MYPDSAALHRAAYRALRAALDIAEPEASARILRAYGIRCKNTCQHARVEISTHAAYSAFQFAVFTRVHKNTHAARPNATVIQQERLMRSCAVFI